MKKIKGHFWGPSVQPVPSVHPSNPVQYKLIGPQKKIIREFLLNLIWVHFTGKSFVFFSTFSTISKKSNLEGVFEFFYLDPQLDQTLKPTRNLCGQLLYIYVYMCLVFNIS